MRGLGIMLLPALLALRPGPACGQGPPEPAVSRRSVADVTARAGPVAPPPSAQAAAHLAPPAGEVGQAHAWRQWAQRRAALDQAAAPFPEPMLHEVARRPIAEWTRAGTRWLWDELVDNVERLCGDFKHLYTGKHLCYLGLTIATAGVLAHTPADRAIQDWYQRDVRSQRTDDWTRIGYHLGQHKITVPVYVGVMGVGKLCQERVVGGLAYEWSNRTLRAMIVGAPAVGVLQYGLGASRPVEGDARWRPFQDSNTVAGHGFIGAVPFLAAASMTENRVLKGVFVTGSFWTTWARFNDDAHFFSQCLLGWTIACLSTRSVVETDATRVELVPVHDPQGQGVGVGLHWRY